MREDKLGFTLIEVLFAASIAVVLVGATYGVIMQVRDTGSALEMRAAARSEAERAVYIIGRELGEASLSSLSTLPASSIRYRVAVDGDGDGTALDASGQVEWSAERAIRCDGEDANNDGLGDEQAVLVDGDKVTVLANGLAPAEVHEDGTDRPGLWFEAAPGGVRVLVRVQRISRPAGHVLIEEVAETISVRNL